MDLQKKIDGDLREAIKNGDGIRSSTLKMLKSDITYEKAKKGEELNDEKVLEVIARAAKRRKESIAHYLSSGWGKSQR